MKAYTYSFSGCAGSIVVIAQSLEEAFTKMKYSQHFYSNEVEIDNIETHELDNFVWVDTGDV